MTTELKNVATLTDEFANQMTAQGNALNEALKALDADYKTKRGSLVAQIASVDRVVKALATKGTTQQGISFRKPMSAEGRANIAAALKARRERLAAEKAGSSTEDAAGTPAATQDGDAVAEARLTREFLLGEGFTTELSDDQDNGILTSHFSLPGISAADFQVNLLEVAEDESGKFADGAMPLREWQVLEAGNLVAAGYGVQELQDALATNRPQIEPGYRSEGQKSAAKRGARRGRA